MSDLSTKSSSTSRKRKHEKSCDRIPQELSTSKERCRHDERRYNKSTSEKRGADYTRGTQKTSSQERPSSNTYQKRNSDSKYRRNEAREAGSPNFTTDTYGSKHDNIKKEQEEEKSEKPNFSLSGKLTEDTNTYKGVVIKYNEPPEARKPKKRWRIYPFKGDEALPVLHLHRQSAYLIGRDRRIADIPSDHPSCSKQHAVLQFRMVDFVREDGTTGRRVRPYVIDLGSANGTYVNNNRIDSQRYVELLERDVVKFGYSTREYVMLLDTSDTKNKLDETSPGQEH